MTTDELLRMFYRAARVAKSELRRRDVTEDSAEAMRQLKQACVAYWVYRVSSTPPSPTTNNSAPDDDPTPDDDPMLDDDATTDNPTSDDPTTDNPTTDNPTTDDDLFASFINSLDFGSKQDNGDH